MDVLEALKYFRKRKIAQKDVLPKRETNLSKNRNW